MHFLRMVPWILLIGSLHSLVSGQPPSDTLTTIAVYPVFMPVAPNARVIESDSTLRWQNGLEWSDRLVRESGVIAYRQGGFNRPDEVFINGYSPRMQRLYVEGMSVGNAVTGRAAYPHLSLERLATAQQYASGTTMRTDFSLHRYYTRKPLTRVRYTQGPYELRSTESMLSQMITRRLGAEIMYHGKNAAGEYRRSGTESRQMSARSFYHLSERYVAQTMLVYNGVQLQESDGYTIANLSSFNFSRFFASPLQNNARSSVRHTQLQLAVMRRGPADSLQTDQADARLLVYYERYRRFFRSPTDTSAYRYEGLHTALQRNWSGSLMHAQADLRGSYYFTRTGSRASLGVSHWSSLDAEVHATVFPQSRLRIPLHTRVAPRSDGYIEGELLAGVQISPHPSLTLSAEGALGRHAPTMQQRFWRGSFRGNPDLQIAQIGRISGAVRFMPGQGIFRAELSGYTQTTDRFTVVGPDSTFAQITDIGQWGGVVRALYTTPRWDIEVSTTALQFTGDNPDIAAQLLTGSGLRLWNRASIHWKGYMFDRATYVRMGFYGVFSPNVYRAARYFPITETWDNSTLEPEIPGFARLDFDLTARVRTLFFLLRYENIAQGLAQLGSYETAGYPLPSRRMFFGLRVYFTN